MTNKEKAIQFLEYVEQKDPRCDILIFMLGAMFNLSPQVVLDKIKELAQ